MLDSSSAPGEASSFEFAAYKLLYTVCRNDPVSAAAELETLPARGRRDPTVRHALAVARAVARSDYSTFFALYRVDAAPKMSGYLMDHLVTRVRARGLEVLLKAYPRLSLDFLRRQLGLRDGLATLDGDLRSFLVENAVVVLRASDGGLGAVHCKASRLGVSAADGVLTREDDGLVVLGERASSLGPASAAAPHAAVAAARRGVKRAAADASGKAAKKATKKATAKKKKKKRQTSKSKRAG